MRKFAVLFALVLVVVVFTGCTSVPDRDPFVLNPPARDSCKAVSADPRDIGNGEQYWDVVVEWRGYRAGFQVDDEREALDLVFTDSLPMELWRTEKLVSCTFVTYRLTSPEGRRYSAVFVVDNK